VENNKWNGNLPCNWFKMKPPELYQQKLLESVDGGYTLYNFNLIKQSMGRISFVFIESCVANIADS
jgi:hypothetical protein